MPGPQSVQYKAVNTTSANFTTPMAPGQQFMFSANVDCWVRVAATATAAAANAAENQLYIKGQILPLKNVADDGNTTTNGFVKVIRDSVNGDATLTLVDER